MNAGQADELNKILSELTEAIKGVNEKLGWILKSKGIE